MIIRLFRYRKEKWKHYVCHKKLVTYTRGHQGQTIVQGLIFEGVELQCHAVNDIKWEDISCNLLYGNTDILLVEWSIIIEIKF